ncbi:thioredoxin family protein [Listeria monocytogenes]|nr:thioredoxin family protein [Listeria monocytogenes]
MKKIILIILGGICIFAIVTLAMSDQKENYYQKVSTNEAKDIISSSSGDELIYFYKKGCAACNSFKPILNAKIKEDNVKVYAIDVEAKENEGEFFEQYNINSTPTLIKFVNGKSVNRHEGAMTKKELDVFINN